MGYHCSWALPEYRTRFSLYIHTHSPIFSSSFSIHMTSHWFYQFRSHTAVLVVHSSFSHFRIYNFLQRKKLAPMVCNSSTYSLTPPACKKYLIFIPSSHPLNVWAPFPTPLRSDTLLWATVALSCLPISSYIMILRVNHPGRKGGNKEDRRKNK